jgi:hypothetical protein
MRLISAESNGCDDAHLATAARTRTDVNHEHPTQSLHPTHRAARLEFMRVASARHRGDDVAGGGVWRSGQTRRHSEPDGRAGAAPRRQAWQAWQ